MSISKKSRRRKFKKISRNKTRKTRGGVSGKQTGRQITCLRSLLRTFPLSEDQEKILSNINKKHHFFYKLRLYKKSDLEIYRDDLIKMLLPFITGKHVHSDYFVMLAGVLNDILDNNNNGEYYIGYNEINKTNYKNNYELFQTAYCNNYFLFHRNALREKIITHSNQDDLSSTTRNVPSNQDDSLTSRINVEPSLFDPQLSVLKSNPTEDERKKYMEEGFSTGNKAW